MRRIQNSYLSLIFTALWGWILLEIPLLVRYLVIKNKVYEYDEKNIHVSEGVLNKNSMTIPLIKIETVNATSNIFGNGTISINSRAAGSYDSRMHNFEYIKSSANERRLLMEQIEKAREAQGVRAIDTF